MLGACHLLQQLHGGPRGVWELPHHGLVEEDAQRVGVHGRGRPLAQSLLRGEVARGAQDHALGGDGLEGDVSGEAEVGELGAAIDEEDVGRLQVTVDEALAVQGDQGLCDLAQGPEVLPALVRVVDACGQGALGQLHEEVGLLAAQATLVAAHHMRVHEPQGGGDLPALALAVARDLQVLEREVGSGAPVDHLEDLAVAAPP